MAAGLGFKDFTTGEVLTAADVDGYLMQGIWVFADATARDAAVTSPQEGNACYLKNTDEILVYSGSTWVVKSGGSRTAVGCAVYSTATQSLTNNTITALTWDAETYDTNAFHSTSTNTSRITIPAGYDGKYRIGGLVSFHPNATGRRELQLYKNGAAISYGNTVIGNGTEFIGTYMDWSTTLVAGDYVELYALQSSGGALTVYTTILNAQFSIDWLGA